MKLDKNTKISPFVIARYEHGYETASSLYKEIHLDKGTYSMWENGNASRISEGRTFAAFHRMCEVFGWTLEGGRNNLSNMYKWKHDDKIKIIKPTYDEWKEMRGHTEMATLDTSKTDISKEEAQEYFGLINTTSTPLSPGEKLWSLHDPVKTILKEIVNNPHFKITNIRKTRKREYLIATKLLWNQMFLNPLQHEFIGDPVQEFMNMPESLNKIVSGGVESSPNPTTMVLLLFRIIWPFTVLSAFEV